MVQATRHRKEAARCEIGVPRFLAFTRTAPLLASPCSLVFPLAPSLTLAHLWAGLG